MIRNIVFDMGDVLLEFRTHEAAASVCHDPADAALLERQVFGSPWWARMDRGGDEPTSVAGIRETLPQRLWEDLERLMERWDDHLVPIPEMNALAAELDRKGYGLYLLSNAGRRFPSFHRKASATALMRGMVVSWEEELLKPDPELYRRLFARYGLEPEECFFIDDSALNIECARHLGMEGHWFRGDVSALRRDLIRRGVDVQP